MWLRYWNWVLRANQSLFLLQLILNTIKAKVFQFPSCTFSPHRIQMYLPCFLLPLLNQTTIQYIHFTIAKFNGQVTLGRFSKAEMCSRCCLTNMVGNKTYNLCRENGLLLKGLAPKQT